MEDLLKILIARREQLEKSIIKFKKNGEDKVAICFLKGSLHTLNELIKDIENGLL